MTPAPRPRARAADVVAALAIAGLAAAVYGGALRYFFSQDDFAGLARAGGAIERLAGPWRYLSHQLFFDLMRPLAGLDPLPYHAASLLSHAACGVVLYAWLTRWCGRPAAFAGAAFFVSHAALFTAVYWISAIGDIHALLFALVALRLATASGRLRWAAAPAFVASLLSKESTLLLPAVVGVTLAVGRRPAAAALRDPVHLSLWAIATVWGFLLTLGGRSGTPAESSSLAPYAVALGPNLWENLLTYLGWSANFVLALATGVSDRVDPSVFGYGIGLAVLGVIGTASTGLRSRGWVAAGVAVLAFLVPVLPLRNHTYHYYTYAALSGVAWMLCAALDLALETIGTRAPRPAAARGRAATKVPGGDARGWVIVGVLAACFAINGAAFVRTNETTPFAYPESRADPTVDRALIAARAADAVRAAALPPGSRLACFSTARLATPEAHREAYWERNVRAALLDGLALEVLFPGLEEVRFGGGPPDRNRREYLGVYDAAGRLRVLPPPDPGAPERRRAEP